MPIENSQCKYCAFLMRYDQTSLQKAEEVEERFRKIRGLKNAPKLKRVMLASNTGRDDMTFTCSAMSESWPKQLQSKEHCKDFIENTVPLSEALNIREQRIQTEAISNIAKKSEGNPNEKPMYKWDEKPIGKIGLSIAAIVLASLAMYLIKHHLGL